METEEIRFHLRGSVDSEELSPSNFDIAKMSELLNLAEKVLRPDDEKATVAYRQEPGSLIGVFSVPSGIASAFLASMAIVSSSTNGALRTSELRPNVIDGIEGLQRFVKKNDFVLEIENERMKEKVVISPETQYRAKKEVWVDAEFYYYGKIVDAGGVSPKFHMDVYGGERIKVSASEEDLKKLKYPLYNDFAIHVKAKQNLDTGEVDFNKDMELIEFVDYSPRMDMRKLKELQDKCGDTWKGVDADEYVRSLRGDL